MVVTANVTLPIVGQDNACQPSIQCNVGFGIGGEHQQVGRVIPPANLFLVKKKKKDTATSATSSVLNKDTRTSGPKDLDKLYWRGSSAPSLGT